MRKAIPTILLVVGIVIIALGLTRKDEGQAEIDLGKTEITLGKRDSAFSAYFILGGLCAAAGLVLLLNGKRG